ncbi:MAG: aldose 1-epimerase family protein [Bacteroidia bacterium]
MQAVISSESLKVTINHFGAELCSVKNKNGIEFIWQAQKDVWARHAPVLFPIVGKLKDNFFIYEGKKYELPQHGFARDNEFELVNKTADSCTFQLRSNIETKKIFPFDFVFVVVYQVQQNTVTKNYKISNPANGVVYFNAGDHPGFNCPLTPNETFEDYYIEFEKNSFLQTKLNNGLRTDAKTVLNLKDNKLFLTKELFDNDALVFENNQINSISLCSAKLGHKITLQCQDWPYFGIWTKKGNTGFICLEPWYGIADHENSNHELTKKEGIIHLPPKLEFKCAFSLIFS